MGPAHTVIGIILRNTDVVKQKSIIYMYMQIQVRGNMSRLCQDFMWTNYILDTVKGAFINLGQNPCLVQAFLAPKIQHIWP